MRHLLAASFVLALAASSAACANVETGTTTIDAPPLASYKDVGDFMIWRCGTADCHGQVGRNLRIYGEWGMRLSSMDVPGQGPTTAAEYQADYESVLSLEPELLSQVVEGQADPRELRLLGKPMESLMGPGGTIGPMEHKGGLLIQMSDVQYTCVVSWLSQKVDTMACQATLMLP